MSYGSFVHASMAERRAAEETRRSESRRAAAALQEWCERYLPDLPRAHALSSAQLLRSAVGDGLTAGMVRERTERHLRSFLSEDELAAIKRNGGEVPLELAAAWRAEG